MISLLFEAVRSGEWSGKTKHQAIAAKEKVVAVTVKKKHLLVQQIYWNK